GYMEDGKVYPTQAGTPQGGIASPVLANMALDGLEWVAQRAAPRQKVYVVKYADEGYLDLFSMASTPIVRHIKIRANATPYDPTYRQYFERRARIR
uniref:hypothetical protein n=1 Tax=Photorhabdus sp. RM322S TaxID=3342825 RepID=UPI0036DD868E